jgi:hypothetical protein
VYLGMISLKCRMNKQASVFGTYYYNEFYDRGSGVGIIPFEKDSSSESESPLFIRKVIIQGFIKWGCCCGHLHWWALLFSCLLPFFSFSSLFPLKIYLLFPYTDMWIYFLQPELCVQ